MKVDVTLNTNEYAKREIDHGYFGHHIDFKYETCIIKEQA